MATENFDFSSEVIDSAYYERKKVIKAISFKFLNYLTDNTIPEENKYSFLKECYAILINDGCSHKDAYNILENMIKLFPRNRYGLKDDSLEKIEILENLLPENFEGLEKPVTNEEPLYYT